MKKQDGITLIVLVITIIVLLILAGVSLNVLVGQNGVLNQAQTSITNHKEAEFEEKAQMVIAGYSMKELAGSERPSFLSYMQSNSEIGEVEEASVGSLSYDDRCYIQKDGEWYTAYSDGSLEKGKIVWDGTASSSLEQKDGVYLIKSPQDLAYLAEQVNSGVTFAGQQIRLETSIDLGANKVNGKWVKGLKEWTPIGQFRTDGTVTSFGGTFDGQDYTIRGMYAVDTECMTGIFGTNVGIIKNLNIAYNYSVGAISSGLCGINGNAGVIENCVANGCGITELISGTGCAYANLCGQNNGTLRNCRNNSEVIIQEPYKGIVKSGTAVEVSVNGIVFTNNGVIENCINSADINLVTSFPDGREANALVYFEAAGVCSTSGVSGGNIAKIKNCSNTGNVYISQDGELAEVSYAAGICIFNGNVDVDSSVGQSEIVQTFNSGNISTECYATWSYCGGITSYNDRGKISSCYNKGTILNNSSGVEPKTGGISAQNTGIVENCYNVGLIKGRGKGSSSAGVEYGGVVASMYKKGSNEASVKNCYSTGNFDVNIQDDTDEVPVFVGGVIALLTSGDVTNCYYLNTTATGGINKKTGLEKNVSDIAGSAEKKSVTDMKNSSFVNLLNSEAFKVKDGDFPVLSWQ